MLKHEDIANACKRYTEESGVEVTPNAQDLLFVVLNGIEKDPHPSWQINQDTKELQQTTERYLKGLPVYLQAVSRAIRGRGPWRSKRGPAKQITTFDLVHRLEWIVDTFCDIDCS